MKYYFSTKIKNFGFEKVVNLVKEALSKEGFGILTDVDVKATFKKKLDADFRNYRILGACNPPNAFKALQAEDKIGLMLPCNVIVQELDDGFIEAAAVDPVASMQAVENGTLAETAAAVREKLKRVINSL